MELNEEICEFVGAFIGDGHFGCYGKKSNRFLVGLDGHQMLDEDYLVNYLVPLIRRNFPYTNPRIYYRKDEQTIRIIMYSKQLFDFLVSLGFTPGVKSRTVKIPEEILNYVPFLYSTIRGIFDTDGCIFLDKRKAYLQPYPRITLQSASIFLIEQLEAALGNYKLYVNKSNRDGYRNYIEIYGYNQLEKFLKEIGFSNKRHSAKVAPVA